MGDRALRCYIRERVARARLVRVRADLGAADAELQDATAAKLASDSGDPAPASDVGHGSTTTTLGVHGATVEVLLGASWRRLTSQNSVAFGAEGLMSTVRWYRELHRTFLATRSPTGPLAWRLSICGCVVEGFALVPLDPWEWIDPPGETACVSDLVGKPS